MEQTHIEQIIRDYGKDILRFCRVTTGSNEEGDELYQDTMLLLLEKQAQLDTRQNVKGYALSTAMKLWKDRRRKAARRLRLVPQQSLEALTEQGLCPDETAPSAETLLLRKSREQTVRALVAALPEKYRLPIQLYYAAEFSIVDIAALLKLPENTVKSRLHRAKAMIREKLEEMEYAVIME